MKRSSTKRTAGSPAAQVAGFIGRFDPAVARVLRACRAALRRRLPTAIEQVYDNYNFLAIGFCSTERTSDCIVSLAGSAKGAILSFYYGATLPDPQGILLGSGNQNRFVRLDSAATLRRPAVAALVDAAVSQARPPLPPTERGYTMVKSVSAKQRPRRLASKTKGPARRNARMGRKVGTIDEYLATLSDDKRAALERLRKAIRAAAPRAEECISYQLPSFRLDGRLLVAFGSAARHYALYPMSAATVAAHAEELRDYETSKGTIRFQLDESLPVALVKKLVKARIAENAAR